MTTHPTRRFLNVFLLAMLNLAVMISLRNLPIIAEYGLESAIFYLLAALVFLFPSALISAELATGWTDTGGVYIWVKEAFGPGWGFFAVWMQWIHNSTWFPVILSFTASTFAYLFNPSLADNKGFLLAVVLIGFWGFTLFNCFDLKTSVLLSAIGVIVGTILPGVLLIALGLHWKLGGHPMHFHFSFDALLPHITNLEDLVFLTGLFLAFGGLEVSAVHASDVQRPQKSFPRAMAIAAAIAFLLYVSGALSIAAMVPREEISLVSGLMEAFYAFFVEMRLEWLIYPVGIMIILGALGELNAWISGPIRALHATSNHGDLPPVLQKLNRHGRPANLLFFQAILVTLTSFAFLFMPTASGAFWILSAMSVQLYLVMYVLMFLAAIKLRYSHPHVVRSYKIPYKMPGIWFVASLGILSSTLGFCLGFVPPKQLQVGNLWIYDGFLALGLIVMSLIPYLIYKKRDPAWLKPENGKKNRADL